MELSLLIRSILLEDINLQLQQLKDKYVGEGKPLTEDDFRRIEKVSQGKWYLIAWLTKRVANKLIKTEDIYKWEEYFQIYEKNKKKFKFQDINLYKTLEDIQSLIDNVIEIREGQIKFEDIANSNFFVTPNEIEKMEAGKGIKYLGMWKPKLGLKPISQDGYQVFQVTKPTKQNWKLYRDMLGRCKGREKGAKIELCTIADFEYFEDYLKDNKGSSYFVLYNLNDPLSPYQLHVESEQFFNKNDSRKFNFDEMSFLKWLSENSSYYTPEKIASNMDLEIPVKGLGYEEENGNRQGLWREYTGGDLDAEYTYENNKRNGPFKTFFPNGKVQSIGTMKNGLIVGDYKYYYEHNGKTFLESEGRFGSREQKVGIWRFACGWTEVAPYRIWDYSNPGQHSGVTKDNKLIIISDQFGGEGFHGNVVTYYPSGSVKSMGRMTIRGVRTGKWIYYKPNGEIRAEGMFKGNEPVGEWMIRPGSIKTLKNPILKITYDSLEGDKVIVYNSKYEYVGKTKKTKELSELIRKILYF